ncbi:hypothetical protein ACOMHN_009759 [Nucella lapillus]
MKLELVVFAFLAALVSPLQAALSRSSLLSLIQSRKNGRPLSARERMQQEQALYQHLKTLSPSQISALESKLPTALREKVRERLQFLKRQESLKQRQPGGRGRGGPDVPNLVVSGASSVRKSSSSSSNRLSGSKGSRSRSGSSGKGSSSRSRSFARMSAMARRMMSSRLRRPRPMNAMRGYQSFSSKARGALREGCSYPIATESVMESFIAGAGGCRSGAAVCYMKGMSCVDVGMSMMCCPLGYSSGMLSALRRMKQMQSLINQFM